MIVDSSALVAIMREEQEATRFLSAIKDASDRSVSAATYIESSIVLLGRASQSNAFPELDELLARARIEIEPVLFADARLARDAFRTFGKGRHKAGLNFGDCFTYALSRRLRRPILCKGNDFALTDATVVTLT